MSARCATAPHPIGGVKDDARAWRAAKKLHDQAHAVDVHLLQATQRPTIAPCPRGYAKAPTSAAPSTHLTTKPPKWSSPTPPTAAPAPKTSARRNAGTLVATGEVEHIPNCQAFAIVRTHYVSTNDAYTAIIRARDIIHRTGRIIPTDQPDDPEPPRDLRTNVTTVLDGNDKLRSADVLHQLRTRWSRLMVAGRRSSLPPR
jgi:S-DNA-T family DNA segregation ATPase FtsK/SpoIIIE